MVAVFKTKKVRNNLSQVDWGMVIPLFVVGDSEYSSQVQNGEKTPKSCWELFLPSHVGRFFCFKKVE